MILGQIRKQFSCSSEVPQSKYYELDNETSLFSELLTFITEYYFSQNHFSSILSMILFVCFYTAKFYKTKVGHEIFLS